MNKATAKKPTLEELVATARKSQDEELRGHESPLLKLSWIRRQQGRAAPFLLALLAGWVGGIPLVGLSLRSRISVNSGWYAFLVIAWLLLSFVLIGWG